MADYQEKSVKFYDEFSQRQQEMSINHRHLQIQRWLETFGLKRSHSVLELGCGIGTQTELLLRYLDTTTRVVAVDISPKNIQLAQSRLSRYSNVALSAIDALELEIEGEFDYILLPDVLEHIPMETHEALFEKMVNWIKPDGQIVIHIPHPQYLSWVHKNKPELLQVIDQPIFTHELLPKAEKAGLHLHFLQSYSIYEEPEDYQILAFKKHNVQSYSSNPTPPIESFKRRLLGKLRFMQRGKR